MFWLHLHVSYLLFSFIILMRPFQSNLVGLTNSHNWLPSLFFIFMIYHFCRAMLVSSRVKYLHSNTYQLSCSSWNLNIYIHTTLSISMPCCLIVLKFTYVHSNQWYYSVTVSSAVTFEWCWLLFMLIVELFWDRERCLILKLPFSPMMSALSALTKGNLVSCYWNVISKITSF